jgi:hypothetical protein
MELKKYKVSAGSKTVYVAAYGRAQAIHISGLRSARVSEQGKVSGIPRKMAG